MLKTKIKNIKWTKKKIIICAIIVAAIIAIICMIRSSGASKARSSSSSVNTATVTKMDITSQISSSGTIASKNTYNVTALVSGEIISADFEEGDMVEEGQVLYRIDDSSKETQLTSAQNSLTRAESDLTYAQNNYNKASSKYSGNTVKATRSGYIKKLYIEEGDTISGSTQLADIYNDQAMKIKIPFLSGEAKFIGAGNDAILTLTDSSEQIGATVTSVSNMDETLEGGRIVRYVTFQVQNPGGLTTSMSASASVGEFQSAGEGTFEAWTDTKMNADVPSGVNVEVASVLVHEGDYVTSGTPILRMTSESADEVMRSYQSKLDQAQSSVDQAKQSADQAQETIDNYTITAPISGQVVTKTYKVGDKIGSSSGNSNASTTLAIIYDMSSYTFEMSVDELDISDVEVGQIVTVQADARDGETYYGKVTNVSLVSSVSNGVSTYPVTVTLDETYDLLPGMNVDGYITLASASDATVVPADALMRGNKVYIQDDSVKEAQGTVPAGFREVDVEVGLINDDYVQILSGVEEGDIVYVAESSNNSSMMMPGMDGGGMPGGGGALGGGGGGMPGGGAPGGR